MSSRVPRWVASTLVCAITLNSTLAMPAYAQSVMPFKMPPAKMDLLHEEDRVWSMSEDADRAIRRKDAILDAPEVNAYLQSLMDKLYPEFNGTIRVRAIDDPVVNAFCLANGSVYVHLGMLARMSNETQLATVLAHEGAHFVHRHGYQNMQSVQSNSGFAVGATILLGGIGALLGGLGGASSAAGFSRDLEREADRIGFERLMQVGYDVRESPKVFETLAKVAKVEDKTPFFLFASHPKLQERVESYQELLAKIPVADKPPVESITFTRLILPLRETWLTRELGSAQYKQVIFWLTHEDAAKDWPKHFPYYLGEAYRLRNEEKDADLALAAYRNAVASAPDYAPAYRALGMALHKKKDPEAATTLQKYLALAPTANDRLFVQQLLEPSK